MAYFAVLIGRRVAKGALETTNGKSVAYGQRAFDLINLKRR